MLGLNSIVLTKSKCSNICTIFQMFSFILVGTFEFEFSETFPYSANFLNNNYIINIKFVIVVLEFILTP